MIKNMGIIDRLFRLIVAVVIGALYFAGTISGIPATVLLVIAAIFLVTSILGFCPLYTLFHISTRPHRKV
jgi:hypothetical protein